VTVVGTCTACRDEHPLGDRTLDGPTTVCPNCGSTSYGTESTTEAIVKSENERIRDAVVDVDGVGAKTAEAIVKSFDTYVAFASVPKDELTAIDGVGIGTAEAIKRSLAPDTPPLPSNRGGRA